MTRPMSQPDDQSRYQFAVGSENISIDAEDDAQDRDDGHHRAAERAAPPPGASLRMMSTAVQTMAKANSVPMFVICSSASMGSSAA